MRSLIDSPLSFSQHGEKSEDRRTRGEDEGGQAFDAAASYKQTVL